jgi:hypothetical protein
VSRETPAQEKGETTDEETRDSAPPIRGSASDVHVSGVRVRRRARMGVRLRGGDIYDMPQPHADAVPIRPRTCAAILGVARETPAQEKGGTTMKPILTIRIPNGKSVSVRTYVESWRRLRAMNPESEVEGWEWYPCKVRSILQDMSQGVHDRINRGGTGALIAKAKVRRDRG